MAKFYINGKETNKLGIFRHVKSTINRKLIDMAERSEQMTITANTRQQLLKFVGLRGGFVRML